MINKYYESLHRSLLPSKKLAYRYYEEEYTYGDLNKVICQVNGLIGDRQDQALALYSRKSFESYGTIFATILSGNIWVPVSPSLPANRCIDILTAIELGAIFIDTDLPASIKQYCEETGIDIYDLRELNENNQERPLSFYNFNKDDIAYIMFTSGSTGKPKGVPMTHANYINFVNNCLDILDFREGDIFSDYHDFGFDISIFYLFCFPVVSGAISPIKSRQEQILPVRHFQENQITVWSSVPSVMKRVERLHPQGAKSHIRIMFLCGEPFALNILDYCDTKMRVPDIFNFYGLTETGVENFFHKCSHTDLENFKAQGNVPIGQPLPGNLIRISESGELLLAGPQITPGYLGGLAADRFFEENGQTWFRTGDLVEFTNEQYFCKGRTDTQIKLRGYRIELMDIEVNLTRHPDVDDVICFPMSIEERQLLVAVIVPRDAGEISLEEIKQEVTQSLPLYMVPDRLFVTSSFPVNANGKKDRSSVRETYQSIMLKS